MRIAVTSVMVADQDKALELYTQVSHPAAKVYQQAISADGIPATSFAVEDIRKEHERLRSAGVAFTMEPTAAGPVTVAVFDDTCGNLIMLVQESAASVVR
jgi:catechol 2,3-dioxygenase-like lactoylglutathione lyase family enzyme